MGSEPLKSDLFDFEQEWVSRYAFLKALGYLLRPRYMPERTPDWKAEGVNPVECEDFIMPTAMHPNLMDATRMRDGKRVYIKRLTHGENELAIASRLSPLSVPPNPQSHSVPILDILKVSKQISPGTQAIDEIPILYFVSGLASMTSGDQDAVPESPPRHPACLGDDEHTAYLVMPFLLPVRKVPFETVDHVIDFVEQLMEGLVYMHSKGVAHRDCSIRNIMVDADALFPKGYHPVRTSALPDGSGRAPRLPRSTTSVKYYYIDYGISTFCGALDSQDRYVTGVDGIDQDVPELSAVKPYDAIKVDIFIIGNLLKKEVYANYKNARFLKPLFEVMTATIPSERPEAVDVYEQWETIRDGVSPFKRSRRLRPRDEGLVVGLFVDIYTVVSLVVQLPKMAAVAALRRASRKKPATPTA